jgi:hypothetical protein
MSDALFQGFLCQGPRAERFSAYDGLPCELPGLTRAVARLPTLTSAELWQLQAVGEYGRSYRCALSDAALLAFAKHRTPLHMVELWGDMTGRSVEALHLLPQLQELACYADVDLSSAPPVAMLRMHNGVAERESTWRGVERMGTS